MTSTSTILPCSGGPGAVEPGDVELNIGQLRLALPLVVIRAGPEVEHALGLTYASAGARTAALWNPDSPTGLVGLGWDLARDAVVRMPGEAAIDLQIILFLRGQAYPLVKTGADADGDIYASQTYQPWQIRYVASTELWVVILETGVRYVYGGGVAVTGGQSTSSGDSIEWMIRRDNWIGDSPSGAQAQMAQIWNLSAIEDPRGRRLDFHYEQTRAPLGSYGAERLEYTQSCRLSGITSTDGDSVALDYVVKEPSEYTKPHQIRASRSVCQVRGTLLAIGDWDFASKPDPIVQITVTTTSGTVVGSMTRQANGKEHMEFQVDVPTSCPDTIRVRIRIDDEDWPDPDDPIVVQTTVTLTANEGVANITQETLDGWASVDLEYVRATLAPGGPDAWQDRWETRCLSAVRKLDYDGNLAVKTTLTYDTETVGSGANTKRVLTRVTRTNADGASYARPETFQYYGDADGVSVDQIYASTGALYGAMKSRTTETGARLTYTYTLVEAASAPLHHDIQRPSADWTNPRTWVGPGYGLVIWEGKNSKAGRLHVSVYAWAGYWAPNNLGEITWNGALDVRLGADFVALGLPMVEQPLVLLTEDPLDHGRWTLHIPITDPAYRTITPLMEVGLCFVAFVNRSSGAMRVYEKVGTKWAEFSWTTNASATTASMFTLCTHDHYALVLHCSTTNAFRPEMYHFYHHAPFTWTRKRKVWHTHLWSIPSQFAPSALSSSASAAMAVICRRQRRSNEFFFQHYAVRWSRDLSTYTIAALGPPGVAEDSVIAGNQFDFNLTGDTVAIDYVHTGLNSITGSSSYRHTYRFLGDGWDTAVHDCDNTDGAYYANDAATASYDGRSTYRQFDPNQLAWSTAFSYADGNATRAERWSTLASFVVGLVLLPVPGLGWAGTLIDLATMGIDLYFLASYDKGVTGSGAGRYFVAGRAVYAQDSYGDWSQIGNLPVPQDDYRANRYGYKFKSTFTQNAHQYATYAIEHQETHRVDYEVNSYYFYTYNVQFLRNGALWGDPVALDAKQCIPQGPGAVGADAFFSFTDPHEGWYSGPNKPDMTQATALRISHIADRRFQGAQRSHVVSRVTVNDGTQILAVDYEYDTTDAVSSPAGGLLRFGAVTTRYSGTSATPSSTNGYKVTRFHARSLLPDSLPEGTPPSVHRLLTGIERESVVFDGGDVEVSRVARTWNVFERTLRTYASIPLKAWFVRPATERTTQDGATRTVSNAYDPSARGLPTSVTTTSTDVLGTTVEERRAFTYAFQQPAYQARMLRLNLLAAVCEVSDTVGGQVVNHVATPWIDGGTVTSAPLGRAFQLMVPGETWRALSSTATFDFDETDVDASRWRCQIAFTERDPTFGLVTETADALGRVASTVYDTRGRFIVARFANASVSAGEAGYHGGQTYESTDGWSSVTTGTGTSASTTLKPTRFSPRADAAAYIVSAYVKPTVSSNIGSIGFGAAKANITGTSGQWTYVEYVTQAPSATSVPFITCKGTIQDFRFAPTDALFSAYTRDPSDGRVTAVHDDAGLKREIHRDAILRPVAIVEPQGTVHAVSWRVAGSWAADAWAPGQVHTLVGRTGGQYVAALTKMDWTVVVNDSTLTDSCIQMRTKIPIDPATAPKVAVGLFAGTVRCRWVHDQRYIVLSASDVSNLNLIYRPTAPFQSWRLMTMGKEVWLWIDNVCVLHYTHPTVVTGHLGVSADDSSAYMPQDIYAVTHAIHTVEHVDALGRTVQEQTVDDAMTGFVVRHRLFDGWGNAAVRTRAMLAVPQSDADWLWPYRPRCVTAFDVTTGVMQGEVVDYYQRQTDETRGSDDAMYPYERDLAEASPLARVSAAGRPGANFGVGSGNALTVRHGPTEASNALLTRLGLPSGSLAARTTTPPSGTPTVELFDSSGRPVAGSVGSGADMHITTTRTAFAGGCATVVDLPPAAFALDAPPDASNPYARVAALDFVRLPVTATSSDHGVCNTICDIAGRIRFTQTSDANGATALRYFKYDGLDRLVEGGSLDSPWDSNELQTLANDPSYPPSGDASATWAVRYTWDVPATGSASHPKGRLCQSVKRTAALGEVTETFLYDAYGNVTSATLNVAAYDASTRTITCTYDLLGNITQIVYPPGPSSASLTAQYTYSRLGRTADVGVTGNAARFAAYTYDIHGRIAAVSLNAGKIARTCVYGFQDQLVRVEDRVGSTVLFREDLGYVTSSGALLDGRIAQTSFSGSAVPTPYSYAYQYNPVGWLLGATSVAVGSLGIAEDEALNVGPLAYDAQGNLLGGSAPHGAWSMNPAPGSDRVGSVTTTRPSTTSSTFQYTPDGKVSASDKVTAAYEPLDPLPQTLTGGTTTVTLGYNARQQRVFREVAGARRLYVRGPNAQPLAELTSASASYQVYGPDGLIALVQSGATISVLRDHEGSTRALVGSTGTVLECFSYEPFGALLPGSSTPSHTRRLYTGQEYDAEVDLYAFEARLYDPNLAVCYATDPADEGYSPYTYVQNDPVNRVDPDGRVAGWVASFARAMRRVGDNIAAMNADHALIIIPRESWDNLTAAYALARREGIPYSNILVIPPLNAAQTLSYNLRHNGTVYLVMHGTPDGRIIIGPGAGETMNGMNFFDHLKDLGLMRGVRRVVSDSCYGAANGADGANSFIEDFLVAWDAELGNALGRRRLALASGEDISITGSRGFTRYSFFFAGERSVARPWHGTIATYLRNAEMEGGWSTIDSVVPD